MRSLGLSLVPAVLAASTAVASPPAVADAPEINEAAPPTAPGPSLRAGVFSGVLVLPKDIELGDAWAPDQVPGDGPLLGVRLGLVPWRFSTPLGALSLGVELEGRLSFSFTARDAAAARAKYFAPVTALRSHAVAALELDATKLTPLVLVGASAEGVSSRSPFFSDDTDGAFYWGLGATYPLRENFAARLDLRHGLTASRSDDLTSTLEVTVGVTWAFSLQSARAPQPGAHRTVATTKPPVATTKPPVATTKPPVTTTKPPVTTTKPPVTTTKPPVNDADSDQVLAADDKCPDRAETANGYDDDDGCPDELPSDLAGMLGTVRELTFSGTSAKLPRTSRDTLDRIADLLLKYPRLQVRIEAHTDDAGDRDKNLALSQRRADAVRTALIERGVLPDRLVAVGRGPDAPLAPNTSAKAREQNRRVELMLIAPKPAAVQP